MVAACVTQCTTVVFCELVPVSAVDPVSALVSDSWSAGTHDTNVYL